MSSWTTVIKTTAGAELGRVTGLSGFTPGIGTKLHIGTVTFKVTDIDVYILPGKSTDGHVDVTVGRA